MDRALLTVTLAAAGLLIGFGGLLHPALPDDEEAQRAAVAEHPMWVASHAALTVGQAMATAAVALLAVRIGDDEARRAWAVAGGTLAIVGLVLGTLGTLTAATGLREAAATGDAALFTTMNTWALGLGWSSVMVGGGGGLLLGLAILKIPGGRVLGGVAVAASAALLVAALAIGPTHPWTHDRLLRYAAVGLGFLLLAFAGWSYRATT